MSTQSEHAIEDAIRSGDLRGAEEGLTELVGAAPTPGAQLLLAVICAQLGEFEKAAGLLRTLASAEADWRTVAREVAMCIAAEQTRVLRRVDPDETTQRAGLAAPPPFAMEHLEGIVYLVRGDLAHARAHLNRAKELWPKRGGRLVMTSGTVLAFTDIRDSDEFTGHMLEAIGPRGLLDIPLTDVDTIEPQTPGTYHDSVWPVAKLVLADGDTVTVRIPRLYPNSADDEMPQIRNGSMTAWNRDRGIAFGIGQRELVVEVGGQERSVGWSEIARLELS